MYHSQIFMFSSFVSSKEYNNNNNKNKKTFILMVEVSDIATVDFSIVLFKIILVPRVHRCYIQIHAQPSHFCENENLVQFCG